MIFNLIKKEPLLQVYYRTCYYSEVSAHKERPSGFSHRQCFENFCQTFNPKKGKVTILLDVARKGSSPHFVYDQTVFPVVEFVGGTETASFLFQLERAKEDRHPPGRVLYFLEDDYLHKEGWIDLLHEGMRLPDADYITLYDHADKYDKAVYPSLPVDLLLSPSSHWRSTPSTTNTFACHAKTLQEDFAIHQEYSLGRKITEDAKKFAALSLKGRKLFSPIPGWSTHCEPQFASPCQVFP